MVVYRVAQQRDYVVSILASQGDLGMISVHGDDEVRIFTCVPCKRPAPCRGWQWQ